MMFSVLLRTNEAAAGQPRDGGEPREPHGDTKREGHIAGGNSRVAWGSVGFARGFDRVSRRRLRNRCSAGTRWACGKSPG
jgi:hypothetical protein